MTEADPFVVNDRSADDDFVRFEVTLHPGTEAGGDVDHEPWLFDNPDEHLHPHQTEVIGVLAGEYGVEFEGVEHRLSEGETVTVPAVTPHRHWNPTSDPVRVAHEHHPAGESAAHAQALWTLGLRGKTDVTGGAERGPVRRDQADVPGNRVSDDGPHSCAEGGVRGLGADWAVIRISTVGSTS